MVDTETPEQIVQHYKAALDSVALINSVKPEYMKDAEWTACLARNKEHLKIMLTRNFWTTENLTPLRTAAA